MIKKIILTFFFLIFVLCSVFSLILFSPRVKSQLSKSFCKKFYERTGYSIQFTNFRPKLPFGIEIENLKIKKGNDIQLATNNVKIQLDLKNLLCKQIQINDLSIDKLEINQIPSSGNSSANSKLFTNLFTSDFANTAQATYFSINQLSLPQVKTHFAVKGSLELDDAFKSKFTLNGYPIHLILKNSKISLITPQGSMEGNILIHPSEIQVSDLRATTKYLTVNGGISLNTKNSFLTSNIKVEGFDTFADCTLEGVLNNLHFDSRINQSKLGRLTLNGRYQWTNAQHLTNISISSTSLGTATIETELFSSHALWPLTVSYANDQILSQLEGGWKWNFSDFFLNINAFNGHYFENDYSLKEPIMIRNREISPLFFSLAGGTLYTILDYSNNQLCTTISARNIPSQFFELWLPALPFHSNVMIDAILQGSPDSLTGQIQLDLERIKILDETFNKIPPLSSHCVATIKNKTLECTGTIVNAGPYPIALTANLPLSFSPIPPKISFDKKSPIQAEITAKGEIAPYLQLFYTETTNISGEAEIALTMTGTLENPQISGELKLQKGSFESYRFGTLFDSIDAKIVGRGSKVHLKHFSANTGKDNTITANGVLELDSERNYPYSFDIHTNQAPILQLDLAKIMTSGSLQLKGNVNEATLNGDLTVNNAHFELPKQLSPSIKQVEITYINQSEDEEKPTLYPKEEELFPIDLNIRLSAANRIFFIGNDLTTEWRGETFLKGKLSSPQLFGQVETIHGEQLINGKMFHISQGTINFSGNYSDKASLYIVSEHEIEGTSCELVLKGQLNNPTVFFRSNPPLSQPEILSLILFNKQLPEISSLQGAQLNQTVSNLNSATDNGNDVLSKFRKTFGLECIEFSHSDDDGFSVKVGKYVTPGIFIFFNKSMTTNARSVAISANLVHSLKLEAEIDKESQSHLALKWKHDY